MASGNDVHGTYQYNPFLDIPTGCMYFCYAFNTFSQYILHIVSKTFFFQ